MYKEFLNFQDTVKHVRKHVFMSQQRFAKELGVSFATVNRWETGKCKPSYDDQKRIYEFCKKNNIRNI